jgi:hypothetical protein
MLSGLNWTLNGLKLFLRDPTECVPSLQPPFTWRRKQSQFPKRCFQRKKHWTMDKVLTQDSSNLQALCQQNSCLLCQCLPKRVPWNSRVTQNIVSSWNRGMPPREKREARWIFFLEAVSVSAVHVPRIIPFTCRLLPTILRVSSLLSISLLPDC